MEKPKYKFSIFTVIVFFLILYFGELGLGYGLFHHFLLPKILNTQKVNQQTKTAQLLEQQILSEQQEVYGLIKVNKLAEASSSAQLMLTQSKTKDEKAISLQVAGEVLAAQQDYSQAKNYFTLAIGLNDKLYGAYIGLANADIQEKDYKSAIVNAQKAISLAPSRTDYYDILGTAYYGMGQNDLAIQSFEKAVKGNPGIDQYKKDLDYVKNNSLSTPSANTTPPSLSKPSGLGYTIQDANQLVSDLNQGDKDYKTIQEDYVGNSTYNQKVVNLYLSYISQRKAIAQQLLNKMGKGEPLSQADLDSWGQYKAMGMGENYLVGVLENGNGGY